MSRWIAVAIAVSLAAPAQAQFSPGKLSRAHESISGATACFQCHEPRKAATAERCLACHKALGSRIDSSRGFHGRMPAAERNTCGTCHPEHGGVDASLVRWPGGRDAFDHGRSGFELRGRHASLRCNDCHKRDLVRAADVREEKNVNLDRTHLGLSTRCVDCHADPHRGQFARQVETGDCAACHDETRWKPARLDHAATRFALNGRHANVACAKCHYTETPAGERVAAGAAPGPGAFVRYRPLEFATCGACHTDPHQNRFGNDCARCHTPDSWQRFTAFDHAQTRFALEAKHARVACDKCHYLETADGKRVAAGTAGAKPRWKPLRFAACSDCHRDVHQGRLGADCARCHTPAGWQTIARGAFDHDRTAYPLRGKHRQVECNKCHRGGDTGKRLAFARCRDCHAEAHRGELDARADRGACESCHTVDGFTPATFGLAEHEKTRFALREAHRAVACVACHRKPGITGFAFRFPDQTCNACHRDTHAGQFADKKRATDCTRCHTAATWRVTAFDHAKTRLPLEGVHARTACASCHKPETIAGQRAVRYKPLDPACRACHAEPKKQNRG